MSGKGIKKSHMGHAPRQLRKLMEKLVSFYPEMSCREIPKICAAFYFFFRLQLRTGSQHVDADNLLKKLSCCFLESKSALSRPLLQIELVLETCLPVATNLHQALARVYGLYVVW